MVRSLPAPSRSGTRFVAGVWLLLIASTAFSDTPTHRVHIAALQSGPEAPGLQAALLALALEVRLRTSLEIAHLIPSVRPEDRALFDHPLLYWAGDAAGTRLSDKAIGNLRQHLLTGGTLLVDNTGRAGPAEAFDQEVRRVLTRALGKPLEPIAPTHVVFRSFYRLARPVGRRADSGQLEGIRVGKHYAVIYTRDDLAGAFSRNAAGGPALRVVPGGEAQREQAYRLAVNLAMYAVCLDYKDDHTHVTHLLRSRRGREAPRRGRDDGR